jgi:hypothetical protein
MDQPLTRTRVTVASRTMIPVYVAHAAWFGTVYTFDPFHRLASAHSLTLARVIGLPMPLWGVMYLTMAGLMVWALVRHSRQLFVWALYCYAVVMAWWAIIYAGSAILTHDASVVGVGWPVFVAVACHASAKSILRGEVRP